MVVLGIDAHKRSHTLVAVDDHGTSLGTKVVVATPVGHVEAMKWSEQWPERRYAIEDCRSLSRGFEQDLIRAGAAVVRVPPKLMATHRRFIRKPGKSDPIDALAIAHAAQRERDLAVAQLDGPERNLRLLTDHRDDIVAERTRIQNRLHAHIHELEPGFEIKPTTLKTIRVLDELDVLVGKHDSVVAEIASDLIKRCRDPTKQAKRLERDITERVTLLSPTLIELPGCGALTAAKIIGEVGSASRFKSKDSFAAHNGTAPIPVWSSNNEQFRLNRGGNRQVNAGLHRIAITQIRMHPPAQAYIEKRVSSGKTKRDAIRALRRRLSNEVYKRLAADERMTATSTEAPEAFPVATAA